ncbi:MAG: 16S rRNA (guanine(966)-N(2))-methyltransferase RsmD [Gammaproteobacteria bacterium]|nr:16S rRNA (guanine(966)-N(2))-methyltransferase RsmD [Gammaproteobacteria bacterium]MDE1887087.1 16S rRNA (guanine(966)-N(2))-methyltransferase RsmD [Gammaproteobacteria bacterium]MDE2023212.1 16S rRNA (guanine(966)-N(2))-methyltransferase RsmD [Gammaproteobacteria bacterium]MDE2139407.1 16S rRNA (guanine(966)-N(2))-methyltransferase RsmD [Gammaproteobacteria bacterium]MDE2274422.1 16S rRNA (guanine(966)-N(2))-methyltransferase RsmD [Gammaproteobacteria bacterium]
MFNPGRGYRNQFRIIGGQWRRRRLGFPDLPGIRPSPDRVRETLFNWLRDVVPGALCLDLFAGSGALGLEALSRGAASVLFVDREPRVIEALRAHRDALHATGSELLRSDALAFLQGRAQEFDIVFLDPPFDSPLLASSAVALEQGGWLAERAHVYMEYPHGACPALPTGWEFIRESRAGRVGFGLVRRGRAPLAAG